MAEPLLGFRPARTADQAAEALRKAIQGGALGGILPGEFELARRLGIGRSTVRSALKQLENAGLVEIRKGQRARIRRSTRHRSRSTPLSVCLVTPFPDNLNPIIPMLHAQFSDGGIAWEQLFEASLAGKCSVRRLARLVTGRRRVGWLLFGVSEFTQRWFENSGMPTLVFGHSYPGVKLPSVDVDFRSAGWHAASSMEKKGHRHVCCVLPSPATAGDIACRGGFFDYAAKSRRGMVIIESGAGKNLSTLLLGIDRLMQRNPRPTAILSLVSENTLAIFVHLLQSGFKVPDDISLIGADSNAILDRALPGLTRYFVDVVTLARRVVRLTHSIMAGNAMPARPSLIVPKFIAGKTLGAPSIAASGRRAGG